MSSEFNFFQNWYPIFPLENLEINKPQSFTLLGQRLVIWKGESWKTAYKLPTSADRLVIEFRRWFDQYCHGKLPWDKVGISPSENIEINDNRQQILDRYHQHTQHCSSCRNALKNIKLTQIILVTYFLLSLSTITILPDIYRLNWGVYLLITDFFALGILGWLKLWLEPKFYFIDYIHAERK